MLIVIAFLLFAALFAAWLAAPTSGKVERLSVPAEVAMPEARTSAA